MTVHTLERKVDPDVERALLDALARVRSGETIGVVVVEQGVTECHHCVVGIEHRFFLVGYLFHALMKLDAA